MFNWVAGLIVLLIIAAFFWPDGSLSPNETINPFDAEPSKTTLDKPKIDRTSSFSKESDSIRVQAFRDADILDQKIETLLNEAQTLVNKQFYTLPKERNAILVYQEILALSPNNSDATQGIDLISDKLLDIGKRALGNNKLATANRTLQKLIDIDGESSQTILLTSEISIWHETKKQLDLIKQATDAFALQNYIAPATKNALYYYEQALRLNKSDKTAIAGIEKIKRVYLQRAEAALAQGDYSDASTNVEILIEIDPQYAPIFDLQNSISPVS